MEEQTRFAFDIREAEPNLIGSKVRGADFGYNVFKVGDISTVVELDCSSAKG
jgi:hypothetical protein